MRGEPALIENVDFVTMETYAADMKAAGGRAGLVCGNLRKERDELQFLIWALVMAAGGKVAIPYDLLAERWSKEQVVERWREFDGNALTVKAYRQAPK